MQNLILLLKVFGLVSRSSSLKYRLMNVSFIIFLVKLIDRIDIYVVLIRIDIYIVLINM